MKHQVVCSVGVPMVSHAGLVCACGEIFVLDYGDYVTYTAQAALLRGHISGQDEESHDLVGSDVKRESVLA